MIKDTINKANRREKICAKHVTNGEFISSYEKNSHKSVRKE